MTSYETTNIVQPPVYTNTFDIAGPKERFSNTQLPPPPVFTPPVNPLPAATFQTNQTLARPLITNQYTPLPPAGKCFTAKNICLTIAGLLLLSLLAWGLFSIFKPKAMTKTVYSAPIVKNVAVAPIATTVTQVKPATATYTQV